MPLAVKESQTTAPRSRKIRRCMTSEVRRDIERRKREPLISLSVTTVRPTSRPVVHRYPRFTKDTWFDLLELWHAGVDFSLSPKDPHPVYRNLSCEVVWDLEGLQL